MLDLSQLWKFSRPHTIIGTSLSILAIYAIALSSTHSSIDQTNLWQLVGVWLACLCGNIYIVGLNQLYDVEIDRVNKPDLPLASGKLSMVAGWWIVGLTGMFAIAISIGLGQWLFATVATSLAIGTAYSLPPIRLKQFPLLAAFCILTVRGCIVNLGLFAHFNNVLGGSQKLPLSIWILTAFILVFTIAIAIFKDVPDLEGDRQYQIQTFTLILGKAAVFDFTRWTIAFAYLGTIVAGILFLPMVNTWFFVGVHTILLGALWWRSQDVDLEQKTAIADFYQFIWQLFFLEYLLFPLACSIT
jgi:homogentisate phytyltransferase / homogentisate geranylgeranyltransferase